MNIFWMEDASLIGEKEHSQVAIGETWKDVKIKNKIPFYGVALADIEYNGQKYYSVPVEWYLIEN